MIKIKLVKIKWKSQLIMALCLYKVKCRLKIVQMHLNPQISSEGLVPSNVPVTVHSEHDTQGSYAPKPKKKKKNNVSLPPQHPHQNLTDHTQ